MTTTKSTTRSSATADEAQDTDAVVPESAEATPAYFATRAFTDAGTGRSFEKADELVGIDEGTAGNYRAAGLASTTKPDTAAAA